MREKQQAKTELLKIRFDLHNSRHELLTKFRRLHYKKLDKISKLDLSNPARGSAGTTVASPVLNVSHS